MLCLHNLNPNFDGILGVFSGPCTGSNPKASKGPHNGQSYVYTYFKEHHIIFEEDQSSNSGGMFYNN